MVLEIFNDNMKIDLSTLVAGNSIFGNSKIDAGRGNGTRIVKAMITLSYDGMIAAEGPISIWYLIGFSTTQFEAWLDADQQSKMDPKLKSPSQYAVLLASSNRAVAGQFNNGVPIVLKPDWSCPEGESVNIAVVNDDATDLQTGTSVFVRMQQFGVNLRD